MVIPLDPIRPDLTPNEGTVLSILQDSARPISAYDILDRMRPDKPRVAPTTMYRALTRLAEAGLVHRIESLNAWFAHRATEQCNGGVLAICDDCGLVGEYPAQGALVAIGAALEAARFHAMRSILEVHGRCSDCDGGRA